MDVNRVDIIGRLWTLGCQGDACRLPPASTLGNIRDGDAAELSAEAEEVARCARIKRTKPAVGGPYGGLR
jgi:hypothetical protein